MSARSGRDVMRSALIVCVSMSTICSISSFTARIGTLMVGSVRQLPICIGDTPALLLGPLTVEPPFRDRGIGRALMDRALADAKAAGHRLIVLVGDEAYYSRVGFKRIPKGRTAMPGPVDPARPAGMRTC